jgi:hypothetical protein
MKIFEIKKKNLRRAICGSDQIFAKKIFASDLFVESVDKMDLTDTRREREREEGEDTDRFHRR